MSANAEEWKSQLVRLPPSDRAELIGFLVASLMSDNSSQSNELSPWTDSKNARRCLLVDRDIDGTLTAAERRELKALQTELSRYRQLVAPLPIQELRGLHDQLLHGDTVMNSKVAASRIGCSPQHVRTLVKQGRLVSVVVDGRHVITEASVKKFLALPNDKRGWRRGKVRGKQGEA